jgi:EAL domain-containing protein (putative c-di-GMP-specific phosphodiesterase class I)
MPMPVLGSQWEIVKAEENWLRDADIALYQAKARGKNRYEFFHPEMQTDIGRRVRLEFDLRCALAAEQFHLVYQPIYNLSDLTVVGVEALLRWTHPTEGLLGPDEFIPILEQNGQIGEVGAWVLREATMQVAAWHARGYALDETTGEMNILRADHVDEAQGFLFARPLEAGLLEAQYLESARLISRAP